MVELKKSKKADSIGYLYRAALYLGLGDKDAGLLFLKKSASRLKSANALYRSLQKITPQEDITNSKLKQYAEKILDEYKRQLYLL